MLPSSADEHAWFLVAEHQHWVDYAWAQAAEHEGAKTLMSWFYSYPVNKDSERRRDWVLRMLTMLSRGELDRQELMERPILATKLLTAWVMEHGSQDVLSTIEYILRRCSSCEKTKVQVYLWIIFTLELRWTVWGDQSAALGLLLPWLENIGRTFRLAEIKSITDRIRSSVRTIS